MVYQRHLYEAPGADGGFIVALLSTVETSYEYRASMFVNDGTLVYSFSSKNMADRCDELEKRVKYTMDLLHQIPFVSSCYKFDL